MTLLGYLLLIPGGYLLGAVPTGLVIGYLFTGDDIRKRGSGKTGATNVLRTAGPLAFAIVVVFDIAKGVIPAVVGRFVFDDYGAAGAGAASAIVGHVYPVFAGFRGGRGLASAFGGVLALTPLIGVALPVVAVIIVGASRYMSLMSVLLTPLTAVAIIAAAFAGRVPWAVVPFALFATVFILYTHLPNIRRLLAGTEPKLGRGGDRAATG